jgi:hypothetical protein
LQGKFRLHPIPARRAAFGSQPPSTRPSPQGKGESFAVCLKIRATGMAGRSSANRNQPAAISSLGGKAKGEGGRKTNQPRQASFRFGLWNLPLRKISQLCQMALLLCHCDAFGATFSGLQNGLKLNLVLCLQGFHGVPGIAAL